MLRLEDFAAYLSQLGELVDPELVVLKSHMLIERVLIATAAVRLREADEARVPRLPFRALVDIADREGKNRKPLIWYNDLRNALAHEFDALDGKEFIRALNQFKLPWPSSRENRLETVRVLAIHVLLLAQQLYFHESAEQLTLERAGSLPSGGELALRASMKVHDDIERSEQLLETLRRTSGLIST